MCIGSTLAPNVTDVCDYRTADAWSMVRVEGGEQREAEEVAAVSPVLPKCSRFKPLRPLSTASLYGLSKAPPPLPSMRT